MYKKHSSNFWYWFCSFRPLYSCPQPYFSLSAHQVSWIRWILVNIHSFCACAHFLPPLSLSLFSSCSLVPCLPPVSFVPSRVLSLLSLSSSSRVFLSSYSSLSSSSPLSHYSASSLSPLSLSLVSLFSSLSLSHDCCRGIDYFGFWLSKRPSATVGIGFILV